MDFVTPAATPSAIFPASSTEFVPLDDWLRPPTVADCVLSVWDALNEASADDESKNVTALAFVVIVRASLLPSGFVMVETSVWTVTNRAQPLRSSSGASSRI